MPAPTSNRIVVLLACICCVIPIATVIVCASWSMWAHLAPRCFPLLDGCLSISAACRPKPVVYLFRSFMLPMSGVLVVFWWLQNSQLKNLVSEKVIFRRIIALLSIVGSVFLSLYVVFLGTDGAMYEFLRRLGIYVFFGGTGIAQLLTTFLMRFVSDAKSSAQQRLAVNAWRIQVVIVLTMLTLGPLNLLLKGILEDPKNVENIIEWNFGLIMFAWYGMQAFVFQQLDKSKLASK